MLEEECRQHGAAISFEFQNVISGFPARPTDVQLEVVSGGPYQGRGTVLAPSPHPVRTLAPQRERDKEIEKDGQSPHRRPLPETLNSAMVQSLLANRV